MAETPSPEQTVGMEIANVINNPEVEKLYINRTIVGNTGSDMFLIAQSTGTPQKFIQLSFNTAKTLAMDILGMITQIENHTGQKILTLREIQQGISQPANTNSQ